jgi:hypothetical protein
VYSAGTLLLKRNEGKVCHGKGMMASDLGLHQVP